MEGEITLKLRTQTVDFLMTVLQEVQMPYKTMAPVINEMTEAIRANIPKEIEDGKKDNTENKENNPTEDVLD